MEELKPCICGSHRIWVITHSSFLHRSVTVHCPECGRKTKCYFTKKKAIKMWNALYGQEEKPQKYGQWQWNGVWEICSACEALVIQPHISGQPRFNYCPYCGAIMVQTKDIEV